LHSHINNGEPIFITSASRAGLTGLAFKTGGLLFIFYFIGLNPLLKAFDSPLATGTISALKMSIACASSIFLAFGLIGLLSLGVTGSSRKRVLGVTGTVVALLGLTSYIVGSIYIYNFPDRAFRQFFTPAGSTLIMLGMLLLGGAVLAAGTLRGWRAATPLLVALYFPLQFPFQATFLLKQGRGPSPMLLGMWGVLWFPLGVAVCTSGRGINRNSAAARRGMETCREEQVVRNTAG
jgi:hypothetical protein